MMWKVSVSPTALLLGQVRGPAAGVLPVSSSEMQNLRRLLTQPGPAFEQDPGGFTCTEKSGKYHFEGLFSTITAVY